MKKIIALLLALLCLATLLVSCGKKDDGEDDGTVTDPVLVSLQEAYDASVADTSSATITYFSEDGMVDYSIDLALTTDGGEDKEGNALDYLTIPYFNYITVSGSAVTLPEYLDGEIKANPESSSTVVKLDGVTFNPKYFKDGAYTFEKSTFKAVITDCEGFFGTNAIQAEVEVKITMANNTVKKVAMEYVTAQGYTVEIDMKFTY